MTATRVIDDHIELANIGTKTHAEIEGHIQGIGNYAFPSADGGADQILKSNGAGVLGWIDQPAGFACGSLNACNLSDIGTRPHSQLTNIGADDHHIKYTDAEAVAAADASNKFIERNVVNDVTAPTTIRMTTLGLLLDLLWDTPNFFLYGTGIKMSAKATGAPYQNLFAAISFPAVYVEGSDVNKQVGEFIFYKNAGENQTQVWIACANTSAACNPYLKLHYDKLELMNVPIQNIKNHAHSALSGTKKLIEVLIGSTPYYIEASPTKA